jgi:hypothetical protein
MSIKLQILGVPQSPIVASTPSETSICDTKAEVGRDQEVETDE